MNPCKFNTYLTAYVLRDMDQKRLDALDAHLESCPECQKQAAALRDTLSLLKEAFPTEKAQTGKAPVLDPERRQQLLTIKALPKQSAFMHFINKAYRPLRMIAASLLCVFGILAILKATMMPSIKGPYMSSRVLYNSQTFKTTISGGGWGGMLSTTAKGATGDSAGGLNQKSDQALEKTDSLTTVLQDSDARMDASGAWKSKLREQAGQKIGNDLGWSSGEKDANLRGKAKHADRNADGYEVGVIVNGPGAPAAEPEPAPIKTQPETIDEVTAVKSPVVMRGVYSSRILAGRVSAAPEGATTPAPAETVATPPVPATPMPTAGGNSFAYDKEVAAPEKTESSIRFRLGGAKSGLARVAGEETEKDGLRAMEPLKVQVAKPSFTGTPKDIRSPNLEKHGERDNKPADYPVVTYERVAESKVAPDSKFQQKGIGGLVNGETVVSAGTLITGKRELKRSEVPQKVINELKKVKPDDDGDGFAYSDGAKAADQSRIWADSNGQNQKAEKKLEEFAEAADLRKKPAPPREPLPFNAFVAAATEPFSTFAMDVDTASYTLTRQALRSGKLPDPERVRLEEIVNALDYADTAPDRATFRVYQDGAQSPFGAGYNLLRIGVKGRRLGREEQRPAMLTFVIDVSGSMSQPDRIGFARQALSSLLDQVGTGDRIQIIAYSDQAQFVLPPSPATEKARIMAAFDRLQCNGSTNLEEGLRRAYEQAGQAYIPGAENRVILISDGVANLGADSAQEILDKVVANRKQGITCSVFGVGTGTYNDKMLQELANKGDGVYRFLDSADEVKTAFVDDLAATLNFIAKDAKIQVEWNPKTVRRYRQMGYEKRKLTKEEFRDDAVDAGEVGSGQFVTALYELELMPDVTPESSLGTVRIRYQRTDNGKVEEIESALVAATVLRPAHQASVHFKVAASAAQFAELLRGNPNARNGRFDTVADYLRPAALERSLDTRVKELLELVTTAASLTK
jgi:Ca-activated chloride channel family protein